MADDCVRIVKLGTALSDNTSLSRAEWFCSRA